MFGTGRRRAVVGGAFVVGMLWSVSGVGGGEEAKAPRPLRVVVGAFQNQDEGFRGRAGSRKEDQGAYLANLVEQRLRELPFVEVLPRPRAGSAAKDVDFVLQGDYLPLVNGRYRLSLRLVGREGGTVATWSDEAPSWRSLVMDSRDLDPLERAELQTDDRQAPEDRRSLVTALAADVGLELQRQHALRELCSAAGAQDALRATIRLIPRQDVYKTGDEVSVAVLPEVDCYVTVLHVRAGGVARLICPSRLQAETAARARIEFFTSPRALAIRALGPAVVEETRLHIFLTREPLKLPEGLWGARTPDDQLKLVTAIRDAVAALPAGSWARYEVPLRIGEPPAP